MFRCTNIIRDEKGTILVYTLQDENGNVQNLEKGMLKPMMRQRANQVSNLKLTRDNRIIVTKH